MNKAIISLFVAATIMLTWSCSQPENKSFTLNIEVEGGTDKMLTFTQRIDGEWVKVDSVKLSDGKASFSKEIDLPEFYYITVEGQRNFMPVFVEAGEIHVTSSVMDIGNPTVTGSKTNILYDSFLQTLNEFEELYKPLGEQFRKAREDGDEELMETILEEFDHLDTKKAEYIIDFATKTNSSVVSPFIAMTYSYMFELSDLEKVSNVLDPSISSSMYTKSLNDRISVLQRVDIGQPFVDFTLNDPDGNPVSLSSSVKGKYVLVDFWASWCGPCRRENPNVVDAYNKFNAKGFDVFGVSFDQKHNNWIKAIADDNLTWTHVSDLKYWSSEAGKLYGVKSIPHSILLDKDGIIIAKNLRGEALHEKLAELLN